MASAVSDENLTAIQEETLPALEPTQVPETFSEALLEPVAEHVAEPEAEAVAEPVEQPVAEPVEQPEAEPVEQPVAEPVVEPVAEPIVEPDKEKHEGFDAIIKSETALKEGSVAELTAPESGEGSTDSDSVGDGEEFDDTGESERSDLETKKQRRARLKAMRKGYFAEHEKDDDEEEPEEPEGEAQIDEGETNIPPSPTQTDLIEKKGSISVHSLDDNDIEKLLQEDREDEFDKTDATVREKPAGVNTIALKDNFLKFFEMPSLSDISEDAEVKPKNKRKTSRAEYIEIERLVDAYRRKSSVPRWRLSSSSDDSKSSDGLDYMALSAFESKMDMSDRQKSKIEDEDPYVMFKGEVDFGVTQQVIVIKDIDELIPMAREFLEELFDKIVTDFEYEKLNKSLRNKLDAESLWLRLKKEVDDYVYQKELNHFLNARMIDYYKRMKSQRQFQTLSKPMMIAEYKRRNDALKLYDHVLNVEKETKKNVSYLMTSVLMDLTYVDNIERDTEEHLENVILNTINIKKSEYLMKVADRELRAMGRKRNEISDERLALITRKHTLARITEKIDTLEKIADGIYMDDFINIQNEVVALEKKIEEKHIELKKLRAHYDMDLHLTQHNRDKTLSLQSRLLEAHDKFYAIQKRQRNLREDLYKGKLERNKIRKDLIDVSYNGGLLTMPLLLHDYDATVLQVADMHDKLNEMRETLKSMNQKIADCEASLRIANMRKYNKNI